MFFISVGRAYVKKISFYRFLDICYTAGCLVEGHFNIVLTLSKNVDRMGQRLKMYNVSILIL